MKVLAILILSLVCFSEIAAVSLRRSPEAKKGNGLHKLRELGNKGAFHSRLISTVELSLTQGDSVAMVIDYVETAIEDNKVHKKNLTEERDATLEEIAAEVHRVQGEINEDSTTLRAVLERIVQLNEQITFLQDKLDRLDAELIELAAKRQQLVEAREADIIAFAKRQERDQRAIDALEEIIPELENLLEEDSEGNSFIQKSEAEIKKALEKIPKDNRIAAFVQLSMKLNPSKLRFVIQKLDAILEAIRIAKADDEEKEEQSEIKYNNLLNELDTVIAQKTQDRKDTNKALRKAKSELARKLVEKKGLEESIANNKELHAAALESYDNADEQYSTKIRNLQEAIDALEMCLQILNEGVENLSNAEEISENASSY